MSVAYNLTMTTHSKQSVGLFYGGQSAEHEVSIRSARNIYDALDTSRYQPVLIAISRDGRWHLSSREELFTNDVVVAADQATLSLFPGQAGRLFAAGAAEAVATIDIAFPILHGPFGEDGTIQGLFELAGVAYVGPGVLGSAVGMDKHIMKQLLAAAGLPVVAYRSYGQHERQSIDANALLAELGQPLFVKPANMGSSVGISKASTAEELDRAIDTAFSFDRKILVEAAASGAEVECAILGNASPEASVLGSIVPRSGDFYSYAAKYIDDDGASMQIPAQLPEAVAAQARQLALKSYQALQAEGLARVDMFIDGSTILINEINTLPGFTAISMYPKLWQASGLDYSQLINRLLDLAQARHQQRIT